MSNPSFSNIDLWLFELEEGNLSPNQIEQLEIFLLQNPEFDVDKDVWEMARVNSSPPVFEEKENLKRRAPIAWYSFASVAVLFCIVGITASTLNQPTLNQKLKSAEELRSDKINVVLNKELRSLKSKLNNVHPDDIYENKSIVGNFEVTDSRNSIVASVENQKQLPTDGVEGELIESGYFKVKNEALLANGIDEQSKDYTFSELPLIDLNTIDIVEENTIQTFELKSSPITEEDQGMAHLESGEINNKVTTPNKSYGADYGSYQLTLKGRINNISRAVQRMMDNPVALKNYRDPHYHVPGMLPNDVNFSSTGALLTTRVQAFSRLQWFGEENQQLMNQIAIDGYAYGMRGGVGVQLNHQMYQDGSMNIADVAITYSPKISVTKTISVEPALRFKMGNKSIDRSKMSSIDAIEMDRGNVNDFYPGEESPIGNDLWYKDLGIGVMINTEWFFIGAQVDNVFKHTDNMYSNDLQNKRRASNHFVGTIGTDWVSTNKNVSLSPYLVYQNKERLSEAWLGANFRLSKFTIGAAVSSNIEPAASIGMKFDRFAIQYNADYLKSTMTSRQSLSHQLSIRFTAKPNRFGKRILNL